MDCCAIEGRRKWRFCRGEHDDGIAKRRLGCFAYLLTQRERASLLLIGDLRAWVPLAALPAECSPLPLLPGLFLPSFTHCFTPPRGVNSGIPARKWKDRCLRAFHTSLYSAGITCVPLTLLTTCVKFTSEAVLLRRRKISIGNNRLSNSI